MTEATRAARREIAAVAAAKPDFDDDDVVTLAVVGYELDAVPLGSVRERWAPEALVAQDALVDAYLEPVIEKLLLACQRVSARWGALDQGRGQ